VGAELARVPVPSRQGWPGRAGSVPDLGVIPSPSGLGRLRRLLAGSRRGGCDAGRVTGNVAGRGRAIA